MLTNEQIIEVVELNRRTPVTEISRKWVLGRLSVRFHWRSKKNMWGRFGGGWNWKLGFQGGGSTWIFSFLICDLTVSVHKPERLIK